MVTVCQRSTWKAGSSVNGATRVVVIGAGVGGLACAGRLARAGLHVTVIEQNSEACAGGRLAVHTFAAQNGRSYRFETGPSLLLLPSVYRDTFEALGLASHEQPCFARIRPSYAIHFADGGDSPLELGGAEAAEAALEKSMEQAEPGSYSQLRSYIAAARANLRSGLPIFIRERLGLGELATLPRFLAGALFGGEALQLSQKLRRVSPLVDWWRSHVLLGPPPLRAHGRQLAARFKLPRHRALLAFQDLYIGLPPSEAIELAEPNASAADDAGVFYPVGGFGAVRLALLDGCVRAGVTFKFGTRARAVDVANGRVHRVRVSACGGRDVWGPNGEPEGSSVTRPQSAAEPGEKGTPSAVEPNSVETLDEIEAEIVVINGDVAAAEAALLPAHARRSSYKEKSEEEGDAGTPTAWIDRLLRERAWRYSSSTVSFFWALDKRFDCFRHHNVFLAEPAQQAWDGLFDASHFSRWGGSGAPFHFYVHSPVRSDDSAVECETDDALMVLVPVPPIDERLSASASAAAEARCVERARTGVLRAFVAAGCDDFEAHIVGERVRTPRGWRDSYALRRGSVFGLSHGLDQLSLLRPSRRHAGVEGLHWCGASTRPGNGVPLVLISAEQTADGVLADLAKTTR